MRNLLIVLTALAGCAQGDTTPIPGQAEAIGIIWNETYGEIRDAPPIYWRRDTCAEPNGIYGNKPYCTFLDNGVKVSGVEATSDGFIEVGAPSPGYTFSDTALAHELLHASIGDAGHLSPKWELVHLAVAQLKAAGL